MKKLATILVLILVLTLVVPVSAQDPGQKFEVTPISPDAVISGDLGKAGPLAQEAAAVADLELVSIIVIFEDGVEPTALEAAGAGQVIYRYKEVFDGASMILPSDNVGAVAALEGVKQVYLDELVELDTDESPAFIGAPVLWQALGGQAVAGEGVVVGVIDSGIWPEHPSFSDPDPSGKPYAAPPFLPGHNGFAAGTPRDTCDFGNTAWNPNDADFSCNNKLIGAYRFQDTAEALGELTADEFKSARDSDGHGTHTTSTAAGNAGVEATILGTSFGLVSGIAPRAHVIMYRTAWGPTGTSYFSDLTAAVEQATLDGVDVLNYSIGGGTNPYGEAPSLAFLAAYENGVFVSCSAGNSGPGANTVGHREPWVTTVAASTQSRTFEGYVHVEADNGDMLDLTGVSIGGAITGELVNGADYGDPLCGSVDGVNPFAPGTFTSDQVVVCQRGIVARVEKSANVQAAGGGGVILYNPTIQTLNADNHFIPTVHIDDVSGAALLDFMASHTGEAATLTGGVKVFVQGDIMAAFSSRGGPGQTLGISKPDVTAPGVNILAGHSPMPAFPIVGGGGAPGNLFQAIGGTSMSAPHVAGAAALLKQMHPDWTPGQMRSALMMTALTDGVVKEDGVTPVDPFDVGSGRIDLNAAGFAGLTISASGQDYVDLEHELWNVNYPSLYVPVMPGRITVRRTAHNETGLPRTWKLTPNSSPDLTIMVPKHIQIPPHGDVTFDITVDARNVPLGEVRHATIEFKQGHEYLNFPVTIVRRQPIVTLDKTCDPAEFPRRATTGCTITIENTSFDDATVSLTDLLPEQLVLVEGSVVGAVQEGPQKLTFNGTLYGTSPPLVTVVDGTGTTPAGYLPLSLFGIAPLAGIGDETIVNFATYPFVYAGETYSRIGMVSNGYAVVGGGDANDIDYINQVLPDPARPNNVLAPFWTDLNPASGGMLRAGYLSGGGVTWLVLDWEGVRCWGDDEYNSFQIWIGVDGAEDISFTYGGVGDGDGGWLTVGAENAYGNSGQNWYVDGSGTPVGAGDELRVTSVPGAPGETHTITFTAEGWRRGTWQNCAGMTGDLFFGTNIACFEGVVTK